MPLDAQKISILMFNLSIFSFFASAFGIIPNNLLPNCRFTYMYFFQSFIILTLIFRLFIHFELIFVYVKGWVPT